MNGRGSAREPEYGRYIYYLLGEDNRLTRARTVSRKKRSHILAQIKRQECENSSSVRGPISPGRRTSKESSIKDHFSKIISRRSTTGWARAPASGRKSAPPSEASALSPALSRAPAVAVSLVQ